MLPDTLVQVVGHADVQCASGRALHDVDVIVMFAMHCDLRGNARSLDSAIRSLRDRIAPLGMTDYLDHRPCGSQTLGITDPADHRLWGSQTLGDDRLLEHSVKIAETKVTVVTERWPDCYSLEP